MSRIVISLRCKDFKLKTFKLHLCRNLTARLGPIQSLDQMAQLRKSAQTVDIKTSVLIIQKDAQVRPPTIERNQKAVRVSDLRGSPLCSSAPASRNRPPAERPAQSLERRGRCVPPSPPG